MAHGDRTHAALISAGFRWNVETYEREIYEGQIHKVTLRLTPVTYEGELPYRNVGWYAWIGPFPEMDRPWRVIGHFPTFNDLRVFAAEFP